MSFFVGYPGYREGRGFDPSPYDWMLRPVEQLADEPGGHVFLIGWGRAVDSGVLVAYFPVASFFDMAAALEVVPGNSFPLPTLPIPQHILDDLPDLEEGERRLLLPIEDAIGKELLKIAQKHLSKTKSPFTLGKARSPQAPREESPGKQAEEIEGGARSKGRIGQSAFRDVLLTAYKNCPVTGCLLEPALSAAHIWEYHQGGVHQLWNGILLRADIHLLFDRHLLRIFPGDPPIIVLDESIRKADGYDFHLTPLSVPKGVDKVKMAGVLRKRWEAVAEAFGPVHEPEPEQIRKK